MPEVIRTSRDATDAPLHTVRETLRSVELPTAQSPFGPVRKREQPPVRIPGQRKPSDIRTRPLNASYNRGAYDEAFEQLQRPDRYSVPAAWNAFGDDADGPAIPRVPGPRQPSDYAGAA